MDLSLARRRLLRKQATTPEQLLWRLLRNRGFLGLKFRRQHPVGPYILDFYCREHQLGVELDGGQHFTVAGQAHDEKRTAHLAGLGLRVLRFSNRELLEDPEAVLAALARACGR
jgi:very-short-patch-repair endonuclease